MFRLLAYLFDLIFVVIVGRLLSRLVQHLFRTPQGHDGNSRSGRGGGKETAGSGQTERDPECGMFVSTELSHRLTVGPHTLHFCSRECLERYQKKAANA